jgi:uncharacterized membrane protein HdeD (DUF308 family)
VLGVVSVASPAVAGTAVAYVIGGMLLLAGIIQAVHGLRSEGWSGKVVPLIVGIISAIAGIAVLAHPLLGLTVLALVLAVFFVVEGVWKIIASSSFRPAAGWLAMLIGGALGLDLGLMIWRQWPLSGLWAVGILVGVDLLCSGAALVFPSFTIRSLNGIVREAAAAQFIRDRLEPSCPSTTTLLSSACNRSSRTPFLLLPRPRST